MVYFQPVEDSVGDYADVDNYYTDGDAVYNNDNKCVNYDNGDNYDDFYDDIPILIGIVSWYVACKIELQINAVYGHKVTLSIVLYLLQGHQMWQSRITRRLCECCQIP